jgi:intein/homing endonuclease
MFINMKDVPKWDTSKHYFDQKTLTLQFYEEEMRKITEGVNIGGYKMHPFMYFHLNFFQTPVPTRMENGTMKDIMGNPPLDDNLYYIIESLKEAQERQKVLFLFGCRGFAKTTFIASYTQHTVLTKPDGNFSIIGGDEGDLKSITSLIDKSLNRVNPAFFLPTIKKDWEDYVSFGYKDKSTSGKTYVHSEIRITNAAKGSNSSSEKGAGLSPIGYIMDEALHEDTLVYKEGHRVPIKDIQVGDQIYGRDGKLTTVLDKINPGVVDMYQIELADNRVINASENHQWTVYNTQKSKWELKTTLELFNRHFQVKKDNRYGVVNKTAIYSLPTNEPIQYNEKNLPIDPYWLGLWLGDGNKHSTTVFTVDDEIESYCREYAGQIEQEFKSKIIELHSQKGKTFRTATILGKNKKNNLLLNNLKELDLLRNKHIPEIYLYANVDQRLALLQGLMDTDGCAVKNSLAEFTTSQPQLAEDFENLCRSLGIALKLTVRKGRYKKQGVVKYTKDSYRFSLKTELPIFKLDRKIKLFQQKDITNKKQKSLIERITIKSVTKTGTQSQAFCIKVDNKDNLFIAGNYIVTHNCGKYSFKSIFESAIPSFKTPHGYKLIPILSGTSGNTTLSKDAREVLENPDVFDVLPINYERLNNFVDPEEITWKEGKKFGTFVPGQMSYRLTVPKISKSFGEFVKLNSKELKALKINVTDWKSARESIQSLGGAGAKESTKNKNKMYYPLDTDDCFLTTTPNPFPVAVIDRRIRELEQSAMNGRSVDIIREGADYKTVFSAKTKAAVVHTGGNIDAPVVIYDEVPEQQPEKYTFVSGLDDYKLNDSDTDSLGAFYVIKRRNLELNNPCETIHASYVSRPERHRDFHATCENLIEMWSAECFMEAVDVSFEEYLEGKNKAAKWLAPAVTFAKSKDARSNAKLQKKYGLFPTAGNNEYRMNVLVDWCWEQHTVGIDDSGREIVKYSVEFIDDIELLQELKDWQKGKNSDRKEAFSHALLYAHLLDVDNVRPKSLKHKSNVLRTGSSYEDQSQMKNKPAKQLSPYSMRSRSPYRR